MGAGRLGTLIKQDRVGKADNNHYPDPKDSEAGKELDEQFPDGMFRFEKRME